MEDRSGEGGCDAGRNRPKASLNVFSAGINAGKRIHWRPLGFYRTQAGRREVNVSLIYGDYFYVEALAKLLGWRNRVF